MLEARGDLWSFYDQGAWVCVTTNDTLDRNRHLVMGGGCAAEAKRRFPQLPIELGRRIGERRAEQGLNIPPTLFVVQEHRVISFPVKSQWWLPARIELIEASARDLMTALKLGWVTGPVYLPRPGCGLGQLTWDQVRAAIEPILDDRVIVVTF